MTPNLIHPFDCQGQSNEFQEYPFVQLIEDWSVAELERLQIYQPDLVAKKCFDLVEDYPAKVMVFLADSQVALAVKELLLSMEVSGDPSNEKKTEAMVTALLNMGHSMDLSDAWSDNVRKLLTERVEARHAYWQGKREKFEGVPSKSGLTVFSEEGKPFLSKSLGRSNRILLEQLHVDGKSLSRHQLANAVQFNTKALLKNINARNELFLDHEPLARECVEARKLRGLSSVHCTPQTFGMLLVRLAGMVRLGEIHSFDLSFSLAGDLDDVHDMRVFLKKTSKDGHMALKVSLFDPEVPGGMTHLRVLPEDLKKMSFHDFDARKAFGQGKVNILSVDVGDAELALGLAGKFIPHETEVQLTSFLSALAHGNDNEMGIVLGALPTVEMRKGLDSRKDELAHAVHLALANNHQKAIDKLCSILLLGGLEKETIEAMVRAKDSCGGPGLYKAMKQNSSQAMEAWISVLFILQKKLTDEVVLEVLLAEHQSSTALGIAMQQDAHEAMTSYGTLLEVFKDRLNAKMVVEILGAKGKGRVPAFARAMQSGKDIGMVGWATLVLFFESKLGWSSIGKLVLAEDDKGVSGVIRALQSPQGAKAFPALQAVLVLLKLPDDLVVRLLNPKLGKGEYKADVRDEIEAAVLMQRRQADLERGSLRSLQVIGLEDCQRDGEAAMDMFMLNHQRGEVGLKSAIAMKNTEAIKAYLQLVIDFQGGKLSLGTLGLGLLNAIRSTHQTRFLGCCWSDTPEYRGLIQSDHTLHDLFKQAERSLKP